MTFGLFSLTFQGERTDVGALDPDLVSAAQAQAFPRCPAREAQSDPAYRACKVASLGPDALVVSVVRNRGDHDAFGRPALRANVCILRSGDLQGPGRDIAAMWRVLEEWAPDRGETGFAEELHRLSFWESDDAFNSLRDRLTAAPKLHAEVAWALCQPHATFAWAQTDDERALFQPAFALLPARRLLEIELATGSMEGDTRERAIGGSTTEPPAMDGGRRLGGFLYRMRSPGRDVIVDFRSAGSGVHAEALPFVEAILDSAEWSGFSPRERLRLLLTSLDTGRTPFELSPPLQAQRQTVQAVERVASRLGGWR